MKILVIAQHKEGKVAALTYEAIGAARKIGEDIHTAVLADNADSMAQEIASRGGGKVLAVRSADVPGSGSVAAILRYAV